MSTPKRIDSWRVVLFTAMAMRVPAFDQSLRQLGHQLVGVVAAPGPRSRRTDDFLGIARQARPGLDMIISNYPNRWADMIRPMRPDLIVCDTFNWKIPAEVLEVPHLGAINGHDALLPKNRGRNATGWALRLGIPHGFTVHYMTQEFDSGPVLAQQPIDITDDDHSFKTIFPKQVAADDAAFEMAIERIAAGDPGIPQDETQATYTGGAFEPAWREIDWSDTARHNFVKVRSWYGARDVPLGAFGDINGQRCLITATKLTYQQSNAMPPGTALERRDDSTLLVQCGDGPLEILEYERIEG